MRFPRRDPFVLLAAGCFCALAAVWLLAPASEPFRDELSTWSDTLLLGLSAVTAWLAVRNETSARGRAFWGLVAAALTLWLAVSALGLAERAWLSDAAVAELSDSLFLLSYLALLLALGIEPHKPPDGHDAVAGAWVEWAGASVLAFGLLAYYVVIPSRIVPKVYASFVSSLTLFVLLDVALVARVGWLVGRSRHPRWRPVYAALAVGFLCTVAHDCAELLAYLRDQSAPAGAGWDLVWTAQFVAFVLAARASSLLVTAVDETRSDQRRLAPADGAGQRGSNSLVPYTFVLPVVHLAGRLAGVLDPAIDRPREVAVLSCVLVLGGLAVLHEIRLQRSYQRVRERLLDAQERVQQAHKMEALGRLAGGIAHEFNNRLSVIFGYSEMLLGRCTEGDRFTGGLEQIKHAAERAAVMTKQLSAFSRGQAGRDRLFDADHAVASAVPGLRQLVGDAVVVTATAGAPGALVMADPAKFEGLLINLSANAGDAMPHGGALTIRTRGVVIGEGETSRTGSLGAGRYVEVEVADNGTGMDADIRAHLFEPFFTTRARDEHRGLGLSIVYGIVRQAGGHIDVDSEPGKGTRVRLLFPRREAEQAADVGTVAVARSGHTLTALVADDEEQVRNLMRASLELAGFAVIEAPDGRAALELARQHPGRIDLLVSDVVMPEINGVDLARRLKEERPEVQVLFVSGFAPETLGDLRVGKTAPAVLQKPFKLQELADWARSLVGAGPPASAQKADPAAREHIT